ncbi:MAG: hypothetical protein ACI89R_001369 [Candidatus Azotimanducaceae bacterium]|jgi:uncharacterized protein (DUF983 family)
MFKKGTKLYSILNNKCPRCNEGDFYVEKSVWSFKNLLKLHENCSNCNLKYMMEPSFFFGAMFVNYALSVLIGIITFVIAKLAIGLTINQSFVSIIVALILFTPICLRLARLIWIRIFVSYDEKFDRD